MTSPRFERAEVIRTFNLLVSPGKVTELRALDAVIRSGRSFPSTVSGYFNCPEKLADAVATITWAKGIYIIPNAVDPALLDRAVNRVRTVGKHDSLTGDDGITRRRWLLLDFDAVRPSGIGATDEQHAAARERAERVREYLRSKGWPEPILADSGNGWHLLYRIDLLPDDEGLIGRCLSALSHQFSDPVIKIDTSVGNPARIWKLYGTPACKGDATADRPHRMSRMVDVPASLVIVPPEMLDALAAAAPSSAVAGKGPGNPARHSGGGKSRSTFDLKAWVAQHFPDATGPKPWSSGGRIWNLPTCPFSDAHTDGAFIAQLPSGPISAGCHHDSCSWEWSDLRELIEPKRGSGGETKEGGGSSKADQVLELAKEVFRVGQSHRKQAFAVFSGVQGVAVPLESPEFKDQLALLVHERLMFVMTGSVFTDVLTVLKGQARKADPEHVYLRVARLKEAVVIDLGHPSGEVVVIEPGVWAFRAISPVLFTRTELTGAFPRPERGGSLSELRSLLNVTEATWPGLLGWMVAAFIYDLPHPILLVGGLQGSGKTTGARYAIQCVDPSPAVVRSPPRNPDDWAVTQSGCWASVIDNVSSIPEWWSDALCKAVTGDGWVKRSLFTNAGITVLTFRRAIVLTSIDAGALRGDLGERLVMVDFEVIPPHKRRSERELDALFAAAQPRILGALFDLVARVLDRLNTISVPSLPRMADYARVLAALDAELGTRSLDLYLAQATRIASEVLDADPLGVALRAFMGSQSEWSGNCQQLLGKLEPPAPPPREWPRSPHALGGRLRRLIPALATMGIVVRPPAENDKTRTWQIVRVPGPNAQNARKPETGPGTPPEGSGGRAMPPGDRSSERPTSEPSCGDASGGSGRSGDSGDVDTNGSDDGEELV